MKTRNTTLMIMVLALLALPALVQADTFIKTVFHQDAMSMMGQNTPAKDDTTMTWLGDNIAATTDGGKTVMVINGETGMFISFDHEKKTYVEMPVDALGDMEKMMAGSGVGKEEAAMMGKQMQGMMAAMKMDAKVTPTEETKKIGDWDCKKYVVDIKMGMGSMKNIVWTTKDVELDYSMFATLMSAPMMQMPGFQDALKEMEKMEGLQILSESSMSMMGNDIKSKQEVLEIGSKDAPDGTYSIPEGYKKKVFEMKMER
jgi:hypothetical protein